MLDCYLRFLRKLGVKEIEVIDEQSLGDEERKIVVDISSIRGKRFSELASKLAISEIKLYSPEKYKNVSASFGCRYKPNIWIKTEVDFPYFNLFDLEREEALCVHIKEGKLIMHRVETIPGERYKHGFTLHKGKVFVDLSRIKEEEKVELPWPEGGVTLDSYDAGLLYRAIIGLSLIHI